MAVKSSTRNWFFIPRLRVFSYKVLKSAPPLYIRLLLVSSGLLCSLTGLSWRPRHWCLSLANNLQSMVCCRVYVSLSLPIPVLFGNFSTKQAVAIAYPASIVYIYLVPRHPSEAVGSSTLFVFWKQLKIRLSWVVLAWMWCTLSQRPLYGGHRSFCNPLSLP